MLTEEAIEEFKKAYREVYNEEVSTEKAVDLGTSLLNMFQVIYRPIKKSWLNELTNKKDDKK